MKLDHLSPSRIETFEKCPLEYFAKYDLKIEEKEVHPLTTMGSAVHKGFEDGFRALLDGGPVPDFPNLVEGVCGEMGVTPSNTKLGVELTNNALKWGYLYNADKCVGVEIEFYLDLPDGTKVKGIIDRLDFGRFTDVIDLKTQKREIEDAKLATRWQSRVYNWAVRKMYPEKAEEDIRFSYWVLRHRVQRCWMTQEDAKNTEQALVEMAEKIRSCNDPEPRPSALCPWCLYRDKCPVSGSIVKRIRRRMS
jgi:putative RecB family exonuclease